MRKLRTLIWGIFQLIRIRLFGRKKGNYDAAVKREFKFIGSSKRPSPGMRLYAMDENGIVYLVPIFKNESGSNGFVNPDHRLVWALNKKNATRKFSTLINTGDENFEL